MKNKILYTILFSGIMIFNVLSCRTSTDFSSLEQQFLNNQVKKSQKELNVFENPPPRYIAILTPVYISSDTLAEDIPEVSIDNNPAAGSSSDSSTIVAGRVGDSIITPASKELVSWDGGVLEYEYSNAEIFHVYASPFRITDVQLQEGEVISGNLITGDSSRWMITTATHGKTAHIYIKPATHNLETTLIINTNLRRYYIILRAYNQKYMMVVKWRYSYENLINMAQAGSISLQTQSAPVEVDTSKPAIEAIDYTKYSFNYKIKQPGSQAVAWVPEAIYDDGQKTYIVLPASAFNHELPVLHALEKRKTRTIINYRVKSRIYEIDRLITRAILSLGKQWIKIIKKKG